MRPAMRGTSTGAAGWDEETLEELRSLGHTRSFKRGQRVVFEGDPRASVVLVESGAVKVVASTANGDEIVLAVCRSGQILGDLSAVTATPTGAAVVALGAVTARLIPAQRYLDFLDARPALLRSQFHALVGHLRDTGERLLELATLDVASRVARHVMALADLGATESDAGLVLEIEVSQEELAAMCCASREAVARVLKDLRAEGIILTERRRITVVDPDALRRRSAR